MSSALTPAAFTAAMSAAALVFAWFNASVAVAAVACTPTFNDALTGLTLPLPSPFTRYFPELLEPLLASLPNRCVVDGEIVVPAADDRGLDFDALLQRIHPAESRVRRLAAETPASFVAFDLLALDDESLMNHPLA